jgi:hypothetical protein
MVGQTSLLAPLFERQTIAALAYVASMVGTALAFAAFALPKPSSSSNEPAVNGSAKGKRQSTRKTSSTLTQAEQEREILAGSKVKIIFTWLVFDCICHLTLEGSFLYFSTFSRTVNNSQGFFAYLWQDYARADSRWGTADPTIVALEILTVLGAGPLAGYCAYLLSQNKFSYHYWAVVLSTAEIYGGFMTFAPEWLTGCKALASDNWMFLWVYLFFMNLVWVFIPFYLLYDSFRAITSSTRAGAVSHMSSSPVGSGLVQEVKTVKVVETVGGSASSELSNIDTQGAINNARQAEENVFLFVPNLVGESDDHL